MPRLNRITLVDRQYAQIFVSKSEDVFIEPEIIYGDTVMDINVAETYPETCGVTIDQDCNWFLAAGVLKQTIPSCQLGEIYPLSPTQPDTVEVIFPGSVTYEVRPGKIKRLGFKAWMGKGIVETLSAPFYNPFYLQLPEAPIAIQNINGTLYAAADFPYPIYSLRFETASFESYTWPLVASPPILTIYNHPQLVQPPVFYNQVN